MNMCSLTCFALLGTAFAAVADDPNITSVKMSQGARRVVTVEYTIENAPAVVTLDIQTNGVSIGAANISGSGYLTGDVNKVIEEDGSYKIKWDVASAWPDHDITSGVRAVVSAWSLDTPPDVIVADLTSKSNVAYYTSIDALPGGLLSNEVYRRTKLVMKRINASGIPWTMGSVNELERNTTGYETPHEVVLINDYYMGVFELTQSQFYLLTSRSPSFFTKDGNMRPVERVRYVQLRQNHVGNSTAVADCAYPNDPAPDSLVGKMRSFTGLEFEVPSEAQWEFACRAMNGDGKWGDGSSYTNATTDANLPGRYLNNLATPGNTDVSSEIGTENGTAIVGSYPCNGFGLYDMHGNVSEWTLDFPVDGNSRTNLPYGDANGAPNANGLVDLNGKSVNTRVARGGSWKETPNKCRSAYRENVPSQTGSANDRGVRLVINMQ